MNIEKVKQVVAAVGAVERAMARIDQVWDEFSSVGKTLVKASEELADARMELDRLEKVSSGIGLAWVMAEKSKIDQMIGQVLAKREMVRMQGPWVMGVREEVAEITGGLAFLESLTRKESENASG
jgi:hypothetical protein